MTRAEAVFEAVSAALHAIGLEAIRTQEFFGMNQRPDTKEPQR